MTTPVSCRAEGCTRKSRTRGYCKMHYMRWLRHGHVKTTIAPLTERQEFICKTAVNYSGDDCLTWPYGKAHGYGTIRIKKVGYLVHRLVCALAHGAPPSTQHQAAHSCGNGHEGCCNPRHLRWATPLENQADRKIYGTYLFGEQHPTAKLTEQEVRAIKRAIGSASQREIAGRFGVSQACISGINTKRRWAHVTTESHR